MFIFATVLLGFLQTNPLRFQTLAYFSPWSLQKRLCFQTLNSSKEF